MKKTIRDVDVTNKRVLVRVDYNVPMDRDTILDDTRIRASLPTIRYLVERRAKVIIITHIGRPSGFVVEELRTDQIAARLSNLLRMPVSKVNNCIGPEVHSAVKAMEPGQVLLLENVRFHPGEVVTDMRFAARLASFADIFVNDAFATAHRTQASTVGVARYLPAVAGLLLENELAGLRKVRKMIQPPVVVLLGGARLVDKARFIDDHLERGNPILLGGLLANSFLKAKGVDTGQSQSEIEVLGLARTLLAENPTLLYLPTDVVVADGLSERAKTRVVAVNRIPPAHFIVDIGPETVSRYSQMMDTARTVIWNGPMGVSEILSFSAGTDALARKISGLANAAKIAGGGETIAVLDRLGLAGAVDYLSTGGAAFLDALETGTLPAIDVLENLPGEMEDEPPAAGTTPKHERQRI